jgi:hypothetical protein
VILTYHWHDERVGCWTRVAFKDESVIFTVGRNHWAGVVAGSLFIAFIVGCMIRAWFNSNIAFTIGFLLFLVPCFLVLRLRHQQHNSHFPIVLCPLEPTQAHGTAVRFSGISSIELRENTGRSHVDDQAFAQIYVRCSDDSRLLVYQSYLCYKDKTRRLAEQVAEAVGVTVEDRL